MAGHPIHAREPEIRSFGQYHGGRIKLTSLSLIAENSLLEGFGYGTLENPEEEFVRILASPGCSQEV